MKPKTAGLLAVSPSGAHGDKGRVHFVLCRLREFSIEARPVDEGPIKPGHFPMQKVEKIKFKISSEVVCPVSESSAQSPR